MTYKQKKYESLIAVVHADLNGGELMKIRWDSEFKECSALMRADILKDILQDIEIKYNKAVEEWTKELRKLAKDKK